MEYSHIRRTPPWIFYVVNFVHACAENFEISDDVWSNRVLLWNDGKQICALGLPTILKINVCIKQSIDLKWTTLIIFTYFIPSFSRFFIIFLYLFHSFSQFFIFFIISFLLFLYFSLLFIIFSFFLSMFHYFSLLFPSFSLFLIIFHYLFLLFLYLSLFFIIGFLLPLYLSLIY